jgi:hypothetical protein
MNKMKNQIRYITWLLLVVLIGACRDEATYPLPDVTRSSVPIFTTGAADTGFINFIDFSQSNIAFTLDKLGSAEVQSIDVTVTFNNSQTGESKTVTYTTVNTFPQTVNLSFSDLVGLFEPEVVTEDTLNLGDSFVINGNVMLADGRYLTGGYSPSVTANNQVSLTYNVACASALAGTYDLALVSGTNGEAASLSNQTITQISPGYYEISDGTMDIFGPNFPVKYRFTDICGNLTADVGSVDYGTQITFKFNPDTTVDPVTGEITFSIEYIAPSCCGLGGIKTVYKATPK